MIYTFYSFKGGVGRSMALANLAESFHEKGLSVIMIDWDLEAPGLETFFHAQGSDKLRAARAHLGLIDMLVAYRDAFPRFAARRAASAITLTKSESEQYARELERASTVARKIFEEDNVPEFLRDTDEREVPGTLSSFLHDLYRPSSLLRSDLPGPLADSPFHRYLQCVHEPDSRQNGIYLISAGARADSFGRYATTVQEFDWSAFYAAHEGRAYFDWFREQLGLKVDVVLIDSRTGVTEMSGVCTRHIPDVVVSFCAPNFQNVDGVVRVVSGLNGAEVKRVRDDRDIEVIVIPTRIDNTESDRLAEFSESFKKQVESDGFVPGPFRDLERPLWNLQIPYIPRYNYREERVIGAGGMPDPASKKLVDAYHRIGVHLAVLAPEDRRIRNVFAAEINATFPHLSKTVPQMAPPLSEAWVERPQEVEKIKKELLRLAASPQVSQLAIWGAPGSGKTSLVARVCRDPEIVSAYPDGILWLTADRHWTAEAAQEWLRTELGAGRQARDRGLQQLLTDRKFLVIADDVWDLGNVAEVFKFGGQSTQVIITRDLSVASRFSTTLVSVGALTQDEVLKILKADELPVADPGDPNFALVRQLVTSPLGASLIRAALDRRLAQGETLSQARQSLREQFQRHEIVAFDQLGPFLPQAELQRPPENRDPGVTRAADRTTSLALSLKESIARLQPDEDAWLLAIAKSNDGMASPRTDDFERVILTRLTDLGLAEERDGRVRIAPLVRAYLRVEGKLNEQIVTRPKSRRISSSVDKQTEAKPEVERAKEILRGASAPLDEIQQLAEHFKDSRYFSYARRLFALARAHPDAKRQSEARWLKLLQRSALCTYRDLDLPADERFRGALDLLEQADLNRPEPSAETLGLAGAIHKYQWKLTGQRRDLERSAAYYGQGAARGVEHDLGYTAINAAFVLDLLAQQERVDSPDMASRRADRARALRQQIMERLPSVSTQKSYAWLRKEWWFFATLAEACFGLQRHDEARYWLREGLVVDLPDWQLESTTRQFVALAIAQNQDLADGAEAYRVLRVLLGDAMAALRAATIGKVGLALSGGGFRASLFHIGVLARMAELDMLRHVEVLSCVSGGSIVGAHYYLEVRRLLQEKRDRDISREDYIDIVRRLERDFLAATQKNLRTRLFAAWWANLRTIFQPAYTRTMHLGHLFERHIYSHVRDGNAGPRWLNELYITPKEEAPDFNPKLDNWQRSAKAPILLLNATTLNTGHNWQFTVSWMGEPPLGASSPIDRNDILRRLYYWEAPVAHQRIRLGHAVAASACVPALFDPVELAGLFPDRSVRLVDGGAHDNQGIAGLLEQECTVMLVSDASGQTSSLAHPSEESWSVALRTNNILMARVREAEYREVGVLHRSSALSGLVYLHLKKDLEAHQVDWVDCQDPYESLDEAQLAQRRSPLTSYGIPRTVQSRLAAMRTDLDSFSDAEAYALMLSGYRMASVEFEKYLTQWPVTAAKREPWAFLSIENVVIRAPGKELEHAGLVRLLGVSASRGFKLWQVMSKKKEMLAVVAVIAAALIWAVASSDIGKGWSAEWLAAQWAPARDVGIAVTSGVGLALLAFAGLVGATWLAHRLFRSRKSLTVIATGLLTVTVGWLLALVHLAFFDWLFLRIGKVKTAMPPPATEHT
jgi:predicted acylesterase/phospholipase RssA